MIQKTKAIKISATYCILIAFYKNTVSYITVFSTCIKTIQKSMKETLLWGKGYTAQLSLTNSICEIICLLLSHVSHISRISRISHILLIGNFPYSPMLLVSFPLPAYQSKMQFFLRHKQIVPYLDNPFLLGHALPPLLGV